MENMERDINIRQHGMLSECGELGILEFLMIKSQWIFIKERITDMCFDLTIKNV